MVKYYSLASILTILAVGVHLSLIKLSAGHSVILKYHLYPNNTAPSACVPKTYWNQSNSFSFNDHSQSVLPNIVLKNESINNGEELRIICISSEPLQWILEMPEASLGKMANYYLHPNDTEDGNRYHICITFDNLTSLFGSVRCESILSRTLGAGIFIQNDGIKPRLGDCSEDLAINFLVGNKTENLVPCKIQGGRDDEGQFKVQLLVNYTETVSGNETVDVQAAVLSNPRNYDPRLGFRLDQPINPDSTLQCQNVDDPRDCVELNAFSEKDYKVHGKIEYVGREGYQEDGILGDLHCSVENSDWGKVNLQLYILYCSKLPSCLRRHVAGFQVPFQRKDLVMYNSKRIEFYNRTGIVITTTLPESGLIYCHGDAKDSRNYVEEYDYFFKGLNGHGYLVSQDFPSAAVIHLKPEATTSNFIYSFSCTISTFVLFRAFNITLELGSNSIMSFHVHSDPNPHELSLVTADYAISAAIKDNVHRTSKVWINVSTNEFTSVSCSAAFTHKLGWATEKRVPPTKHKTSTIPAPAPVHIASSQTELVVTSVALGIVALLSIVVAALLFWKYRRNQASTQGLTAEEINLFKFGNSGAAAGSASNNGNTSMPMITLNSDGLLDVDSLAFPPKFQIPANQLEVYRDDLLGKGEFAFCFRGKFKGAAVAVKMLKSSVQTEDFKNYLKEVKLMASIGQHPNIIGFYGAVIERLDQKIAPVVMELSPKGNLLKFLQEHGHLSLPGDGEQVLLSFCAQIAAGMEYLSHKNVIHGDLAARNILVFEGLKVKITDFGLSKNLYESSYYSRRHQQVRLPWRWMAPESLEYLIFSVHSDIWSFGVLAWEIFTSGQVPFGGLAWTTEFVRELKQEGLRLPKPERATDKIYGFLKLCWTINPEHRPAFSDIKNFFIFLLQHMDYDFAPSQV